jgi:DNA-binding response OmpR family regulator
MSSESHTRVLVVDDDADIRNILTTVLRRRGLTVDSATDGREAIDLVAANRYAVVLLDLMLPGVDGFAVLHNVRETSIESPVVLVVTGAPSEMTETLDSKTIHGIVRKPFDPDEVASIVAACAELKGRMPFETMAIATIVAGGPLVALLNRFVG